MGGGAAWGRRRRREAALGARSRRSRRAFPAIQPTFALGEDVVVPRREGAARVRVDARPFSFIARRQGGALGGRGPRRCCWIRVAQVEPALAVRHVAGSRLGRARCCFGNDWGWRVEGRARARAPRLFGVLCFLRRPRVFLFFGFSLSRLEDVVVCVCLGAGDESTSMKGGWSRRRACVRLCVSIAGMAAARRPFEQGRQAAADGRQEAGAAVRGRAPAGERASGAFCLSLSYLLCARDGRRSPTAILTHSQYSRARPFERRYHRSEAQQFLLARKYNPRGRRSFPPLTHTLVSKTPLAQPH